MTQAVSPQGLAQKVLQPLVVSKTVPRAAAGLQGPGGPARGAGSTWLQVAPVNKSQCSWPRTPGTVSVAWPPPALP